MSLKFTKFYKFLNLYIKHNKGIFLKFWGYLMLKTNGSELDLLTDKNCVLVLVDYQPTMIKSIASGDKTIIKKAAVLAAKAATILDVPVVLSSINPESNGNVFPEIKELFPEQEIFARKIPSFDAFEDQGTYDAIKKTNKNKLVISGLWTSMCFTYTALHAVKDGYDVYGLMDAAGDSTIDVIILVLKGCYKRVLFQLH